MTVLKEILSRAPAVSTPGNTCLIRSFHLYSTKSQRIALPSKNRPHHFLRPVEDRQFMDTGELTFAKRIQNFLPEDVMHCGFLFLIAKFFTCNILDIPGRLVQNEYEILADTAYAVWNPVSKQQGVLVAESSLGIVNLKTNDSSICEGWSYDEWHEELQKSDFIILPMVFRAGACVFLDDDDSLGLLVPWDEERGNNFNEENGLYQALVTEAGEKLELEPVQVVQKLVPTGQDLFIDISQPYFATIKGSRPSSARNLDFLLVKLNVPFVASPPVDKVYVSYTLEERCIGSISSSFTVNTILVDIWMLKRNPVDHADHLTHLVF